MDLLNGLFFGALILYFVATVLQFMGTAFKKEKLLSIAWIVLLVAFVTHTGYTVARGITAGRLPLANQFEFANGFAWGIALIGIIFRLRSSKGFGWIVTLCLPMAFLVLSYAALCTSREITELMPSLRSAWFGLHIGSAVFSYAAFAIAACIGIRYLALEKRLKEAEGGEKHLGQLDHLAYRMICFGFLLLSVVIISGCIWAEQAWNTFWSWDPKETWALITWIIYAIYLHQRIRAKWRGHRMAWFSIVAFVCVLFTFAGVNVLMKGLHSYAT